MYSIVRVYSVFTRLEEWKLVHRCLRILVTVCAPSAVPPAPLLNASFFFFPDLQLPLHSISLQNLPIPSEYTPYISHFDAFNVGSDKKECCQQTLHAPGRWTHSDVMTRLKGRVPRGRGVIPG